MGIERTIAATCPRCKKVVVLKDKTDAETNCPHCGLHMLVRYVPNQEQIFPVKGGMAITMNLN